MKISLEGKWTADIGDGGSYPLQLPGTLDENRIGHRDTGSNQWHPDAALGNENESFHSDVIATRFTRRYTYEGEALFIRRIEGEIWSKVAGEIAAGKRVFLEAERARALRLLVDGREVPDFVEPSISTEHIFEVTGLIKEGSELTLLSDNSYPGWPRDAIVYSSAATDETQTNWNGVLGNLCLRTEEQVFAGDIRVYPAGDTLTVRMKLYAGRPYSGEILLRSDALQEDVRQSVSVQEAAAELCFGPLPLTDEIRRWDLEEGSLYELSVSLTDGETKTVTFGVRDFGDDGQGRLAVNGRVFFLRGEANCGVFPEMGHPPMTVEEWLDILERYRSYGVNCMRFHSHCPPEAAFTAADRMGMLMQPELSHWNPKDAFETEDSFDYYRTELLQILRMLANHPSFVMLTLGNELQAGEKGHERMRELLRLARSEDSTRLYGDASNGHYGAAGCEQEGDFYTSAQFYERELRGTFANMEGYINRCYPSAQHTYVEAMERLRTEYAKPVFSFEVGQFEILPDFDELEEFRGVSDPANLRLIQERVKERGLTGDWKRYVEATGELSRIAYREEVEAVMRTAEMSGISLLGLQDFPGQGTALVGMLNSHLQPKPYEFAQPGHFRSFFRDQLPLVLLPKYTWENTESLRAQVRIANYGKGKLRGKLVYELREQPENGRGYSFADRGNNAPVIAHGVSGERICNTGDLSRVVCNAGESGERICNTGDPEQTVCNAGEPGERICNSGGLGQVICNTGETVEKICKTGGSGPMVRRSGELGQVVCNAGELTDAGTIEIDFNTLQIQKPKRYNLVVRIGGASNLYPVWVYPRVMPECPKDIYETRRLDEKVKKVLQAGGKVYLSPSSTKEALPSSIQGQFTTDFWSVGTFAGQEGGMGQLIDDRHPVFDSFPTEFHTNWQWWPMAVQRAVILPKRCQAIVTEMDSYAFLRPMVQLMECRCGNGKLMFSSMGLQDLQQYPEARALLDSIYRYMDSDRFEPEQSLEMEMFEEITASHPGTVQPCAE